MAEGNFYYVIDQKTQAITPIPLTMTLRDQFAMAALTGIMSNTEEWGDAQERAEYAYQIADAMMEARK